MRSENRIKLQKTLAKKMVGKTNYDFPTMKEFKEQK